MMARRALVVDRPLAVPDHHGPAQSVASATWAWGARGRFVRIRHECGPVGARRIEYPEFGAMLTAVVFEVSSTGFAVDDVSDVPPFRAAGTPHLAACRGARNGADA